MTSKTTEKPAEPEFLEGIRQGSADEEKQWRRYARDARLAERIAAEAFSQAPKTLAQYFQVKRVSTTTSYAKSSRLPARVAVTFSPVGDMSGRRQKIALGTIDKVAAMLEKAGWAITRPPGPEAKQWPNRLVIIVEAQRTMQVPGRANGKQGSSHLVELALTFDNIGDTPKCRLVQRRRIIPAVAQHEEYYQAVECDEQEEAAQP